MLPFGSNPVEFSRFPRDPNFAAKAGRVLDLYEHVWEGVSLDSDEAVPFGSYPGVGPGFHI